MDGLFVFCFKSCLKGDHDTEYYDILQIDRPSLANTDLIKKQYKRLSLDLHPDKLAQRGMEVTPEQKQRFLKVKEAYDVLSDPRRRRLYDQLGVSGLKIIEHPTEVDPLTILRNYQVSAEWESKVAITTDSPVENSFDCNCLHGRKMGKSACWCSCWWLVLLRHCWSYRYYLVSSATVL